MGCSCKEGGRPKASVKEDQRKNKKGDGGEREEWQRVNSLFFSSVDEVE